MAGLVPAIHVLLVAQKTWIPRDKPGHDDELGRAISLLTMGIGNCYFVRPSLTGSTLFIAVTLSPGESSNTLMAMVLTQASMPAAAASAMQSTAKFENLRNIEPCRGQKLR